MSQQKSASFDGNEEIHQDNNFMATYWQHFPRIGITACSLIGALIDIIAVVLIATLYTIIYIVAFLFTKLVRAIDNSK